MTTTLLDPPSAAICSACGVELAPGATVCSACQAKGASRGTRHPAAKAIIGVVWFCTAVVILWFFGSLVTAPWQSAARNEPMLLPGGGTFDLTLGRGAIPRCVVQASRDGTSSEVVIMQGACRTIVVHRWLKENRQLPQFQGATLGMPYTIAAPPGAEEIATRTRLIVSCLFSVAAGLGGAFLTWVSIALAAKLMTPPK